MTFQINGMNGRYDRKVEDESVRYGINSVDNHAIHSVSPLMNDNVALPPILDFSGTPEAQDINIKLLEKYADQNDAYLASLPPLEYEYRYMPNVINGKIDKKRKWNTIYI